MFVRFRVYDLYIVPLYPVTCGTHVLVNRRSALFPVFIHSRPYCSSSFSHILLITVLTLDLVDYTGFRVVSVLSFGLTIMDLMVLVGL